VSSALIDRTANLIAERFEGDGLHDDGLNLVNELGLWFVTR
tara:strand:+ start:458 stop:580 length:123 start_codon:yes stop_codon:yes gene_type:complete